MKFFVLAACAASFVAAQSTTSDATCPTITGVYGGYTYTNGSTIGPSTSSSSVSSSGSASVTASGYPTGNSSTSMGSAGASGSSGTYSTATPTTSMPSTSSVVSNGAGSLKAAGLSALLMGLVGAAFL